MSIASLLCYDDSLSLSFQINTFFLALFFYLTYTGTVDDQSQKYLSLDSGSYSNGDLTSPYRECFEVPNALTGTWTLDTNGYWNGKTDFEPGLGFLSVELNAFQKSIPEYQDFMMKIKDAIIEVAANASIRDVSMNIAYWTNWAYPIDDSSSGTTHLIRFTGQPSYVFDRFYKSVSMVDPKRQCFAIPSIFFDKSTGNFLVQYMYNEYTMLATKQALNYPTADASTQLGCCNWQTQTQSPGSIQKADDSQCVLPAVGFGYNSAFDSSHFSIRYNINSLMTAFAVNMGITPYEVLSFAKGEFAKKRGCTRLTDTINTRDTYKQDTPYMTWSNTDGCVMTYNNSKSKELDKYTIELRIDPKFTNMDPIYCLVRTNSSAPAESYFFTRLCLLRMGDTFVYPYFNHLGTTGSDKTDFYNFTSGCSCKSIPPLDPAGKYFSQGKGDKTYCNIFDLMHGFIVINSKYADVIFYKMITMASYQSAQKINEAVYYPAFGAIRTGGNGGQNQVTPSSGKNSFNNVVASLQSGISGNLIGPNSPFYFCQDEKNGCVIYAMNTYDIYDQRMNADYFELTDGSCKDTFSINDTTWFSSTGPYNVPPTSLIQDYFECYNLLYVSTLFYM